MDEVAKIKRVKDVYGRFSARMTELRKKKKVIIDAYRERLKEKKLSQLKDSINNK